MNITPDRHLGDDGKYRARTECPHCAWTVSHADTDPVALAEFLRKLIIEHHRTEHADKFAKKDGE